MNPNRKPTGMFVCRWGIPAVMLLVAGCIYRPAIPPEPIPTVYLATGQEGALLARFSPAFLVHGAREPHNRIGTPFAAYDARGEECIAVDPDRAAMYTHVRRFETETGAYINLIYRVHFQEVPVSLVPFHLTAGRNVGLITIVTLDAAERPVLVTTAGTCGCYAVSIPTSFLPRQAFPEGWSRCGRVKVYGERLPSVLDMEAVEDSRIVVVLRPHVHRVMDIRVEADAALRDPSRYASIPATMRRAADLERLPLNAGATSFYYQRGRARGHVKGSEKGWETMLMSLISLDLYVGTDKIYGDSRITGNPFYTSLRPWNRKASDMWEFPGFLRFYGWRL